MPMSERMVLPMVLRATWVAVLPGSPLKFWAGGSRLSLRTVPLGMLPEVMEALIVLGFSREVIDDMLILVSLLNSVVLTKAAWGWERSKEARGSWVRTWTISGNLAEDVLLAICPIIKTWP